MKLSDSYLCLDCQEVFSPDRSLMINVKTPVCPGCGNRFNMSIGRVLNRREPTIAPIVDARGFFLQEAVKEPQQPCTTKKMKAGMTMGEAIGGNGMRNKRSVWTITTKPFREAHFATFPPEIPEICIKAGSRAGDTILDPFSGAGTTGNVAERLGRKYIGIELNPSYSEMGERRIDAARLPLFQEAGDEHRRS